MDNKEETGQKLCIRGLSFQFGEESSIWVLNLFQEIVAQNLNRFYPYDYDTRTIITAAAD